MVEHPLHETSIEVPIFNFHIKHNIPVDLYSITAELDGYEILVRSYGDPNSNNFHDTYFQIGFYDLSELNEVPIKIKYTLRQ